MPRQYRPWLWPAYQRWLQHSKAPILVGPFRGEVGFEVLYWLPFLQHLRQTLQIPRERLIPITRGGAAIWYDTPTGVELFAMRTPQDVRIENKRQAMATGLLKQMHWTPWDRSVVRDAALTLGLTRYQTLHPSWMYQTLAPFWTGQRGLAWLDARTAYAPLPLVNLPDGVTLPPTFVAVHCYARPTFPYSEANQIFVREMVKQLSAAVPVVLLGTGLHVDDHVDMGPREVMPNVIRLSSLCPLAVETNLAIQTAVLQRAKGFVGTYGGFAQLALRLGKPSISVYEEWHSTAEGHRHLSESLARFLHTSFQVVRLHDLPMLQSAMPQVRLQESAPPSTLKSPQDVVAPLA